MESYVSSPARSDPASLIHAQTRLLRYQNEYAAPLLDYVGLHNLPIGASPSVENVEAAATTEDTRFVYMEEIDNVVYRWNSSRLKAHWCSCCWGQPTNLKPR